MRSCPTITRTRISWHTRTARSVLAKLQANILRRGIWFWTEPGHTETCNYKWRNSKQVNRVNRH